MTYFRCGLSLISGWGDYHIQLFTKDSGTTRTIEKLPWSFNPVVFNSSNLTKLSDYIETDSLVKLLDFIEDSIPNLTFKQVNTLLLDLEWLSCQLEKENYEI